MLLWMLRQLAKDYPMPTVIKQRCPNCHELLDRTDKNFYKRRAPGTVSQVIWLPYCRTCYREHPELREQTEKASLSDPLDTPRTAQKAYQE